MEKKNNKDQKIEVLTDEQLQEVAGGTDSKSFDHPSVGTFQNCMRNSTKSVCCRLFPDAEQCR